jgi:hypothetical protein
MEFLKILNSPIMLILCTITLFVVLFQPAYLSFMAMKRGPMIGITKREMMTTIKSTAIFAILPSLPILASYLILVPAQGRFFPWLRSSVVGSASYDIMAMNMAAERYGYSNIYNVDFPMDPLFSILLIVTIGILGGNVFNMIFLKSYDKSVKKVMNKNQHLIPVITGAMFLALFCTLATPAITNFKNILGIIAFLTAGAASIAFDHLGKKWPKLGEFSFAGSLLAAMLVVAFVNSLIR